jgi:hypothetical protein
MAFLTPGTITGLFSLLSAVSVVVGKPALGAFFSDPNTAAALTTVVSGASGLVAGALKGFHPPAPKP